MCLNVFQFTRLISLRIEFLSVSLILLRELLNAVYSIRSIVTPSAALFNC